MRLAIVTIPLFVIFTLSVFAAGQTTDPQSTHAGTQQQQKGDNAKRPKPAQTYPARIAPGPAFKNFVRDQEDIWTSPFRARIEDLNWIVPMTGLTVGLINADAELSSRISTTSTLARHSNTLSNAGLGVALGGSGVLWLAGKWKGNDHQQETGILGLEAATNSLVVTEVLKLATQRERPTDDSGQGRFWHSSSPFNSSFPSAHAMITWSVASVIAHEYPGPLTKVLAYGLATGVSVARVTGRDHFPGDVITGSTLGWLIGRQVYSRHHDTELPDAAYGTFSSDNSPENHSTSDSVSSPYVPPDSWVYPAFMRLSALGAIPSGLLGLRPWTRRECARLLVEATEDMDASSSGEAARLVQALNKEFAAEIAGSEARYIGLDSLYSRLTSISGQPLTDGYHFGKTIVNDFGRPYEKGQNFLTGFSSSASVGALGFYVRGEFEHAPSAPGISQAVQDAIQLADEKVTTAAGVGPPIIQPVSPVAAFNQFRLLDTYVMLNLKGWQTSFGKQSLVTGPTQDPFLWSANAEPIYMLRLDKTSPSKLPGFLKLLGPYRIELWVGKLTGAHYVNTQDPAIGEVFSIGRTLAKQPMVNGQKLNFKPTPNFEFGIGKTGLWGGPDFPITVNSTLRSLFSTTNAVGRGQDPGDRRSTVDFSYRIPGLRKWVMIYDDSFTEDEISPLGYPRRSAHNPGIYLPQMPKLHQLDFRLEAAYTDLPGLIQPPGAGFFYWNTRYQDGYTNQGNIIGNGIVGRNGVAFRAQSTYWFASDKNIQIGYRNVEADHNFLQGGNLRDIFLNSEWRFNSGISLASFLQYEWWNFPLLSNGNKQTNFTVSFQLTYWPHWRVGSKD